MASVSYLYTALAGGHSFNLGSLSNGLLKFGVSGSVATPATALASNTSTNNDYVAGSKYLAQIAGITPAAGGLISNDGTAWSQTTIGAAHTILSSSGTAAAWVGGAASSGNVLTYNGSNVVWGAPATAGTVTSVGASSSDITVGGSPVTTSGTITLSLNTVTTAKGGTGLASFTGGDMTYYASGTALSTLAIGSNHKVMVSTGAAPQWITLTTSEAGTGLTSYTAGDVLYYTSGTALSKLGIGSNGQLMKSNGSAPTWFTPTYLNITTGGASANAGQATISAGQTSVAISTLVVASNSVILISVGGITGTATIANSPIEVSSINPGVSFTVTCAVIIPAASTMTINWLIAA